MSLSPRFLAATLASTVLHAGLVALPYLGMMHGGKQELPATRSPPSMDLNWVRMKPPDEIGAKAAFHDTAPPPRAVGDNPSEKTETSRIGADLLPLDGAAFFPANELTRVAEPANVLQLDSPELGELQKSGRVVLKIWVDDGGAVRRIETEFSDVPEKFARFATEAFRASTFVPGERAGRRVGAIMRIEVRYDELVIPPAPDSKDASRPGVPGGQP